jgi:hypothetical protein
LGFVGFTVGAGKGALECSGIEMDAFEGATVGALVGIKGVYYSIVRERENTQAH